MNAIYLDAKMSDRDRQEKLYAGQIFVYSPRPATLALCQLARTLIESELGEIDPKLAEFYLRVEDYLAIEKKIKQSFLHHPKTQKLVQALLADLDCPLDRTYLEMPQIRMVPQKDYLPNGEGSVYDPHRDTWFATPMCQINWWMPIYECTSDNTIAFFPDYWQKPVPNHSSQFNYLTTDLRELPDLAAIATESECRVVCPSGGIILFSAAQMHSAVPNTSGYSRYSLDFRTIHYDDIFNDGGAPNVDSHSTSALLQYFLNSQTLEPFPEEMLQNCSKNLSVETRGALSLQDLT